jgi:esterase
LSTLNYDLVQEGTPHQWLVVLHGIYGQGRNWGGVARRLVRARPDWGVALVDLRMHGESQGFAPPHTVRAAAADLLSLAGPLGAPPAAVLGHSFGGKVALAYADQDARGLRQVWVLDSTPAVRPAGGSAYEMLQVVRALPDVFASRDDLIAALERGGVATPVAQWMATNLVAEADGYRWRFDLAAIEALLADFFETDLWGVVESPPDDAEVHVVKASDSSVLSADALARLERAAANGRTHLHHLEGGHWLNADNPEGVVGLLADNLPR